MEKSDILREIQLEELIGTTIEDGMTIKKYQLILKLNRLLEEIYMKDDIDWGELSVKYGFFDQPHMIKELKKYLGRSPREYLKNRDLLGDIFEIDDVFLQ